MRHVQLFPRFFGYTVIRHVPHHPHDGQLVEAPAFDALAQQIKAGNGKAELKTVSGGTLTVWMNGPHNILIKDEKGDIADISTYDVIQSNGVIQVIDTVLLPN